MIQQQNCENSEPYNTRKIRKIIRPCACALWIERYIYNNNSKIIIQTLFNVWAHRCDGSSNSLLAYGKLIRDD